MFRRGGKTTAINSGVSDLGFRSSSAPRTLVRHPRTTHIILTYSTLLYLSAAGRKKLHTTWDDGAELIEEYDLNTDELLLRKHRKPSALGALGDWDFLVGAPPPKGDAQLRESSRNPILTYVLAPDDMSVLDASRYARVYSWSHVSFDTHRRQALPHIDSHLVICCMPLLQPIGPARGISMAHPEPTLRRVEFPTLGRRRGKGHCDPHSEQEVLQEVEYSGTRCAATSGGAQPIAVASRKQYPRGQLQ